MSESVKIVIAGDLFPVPINFNLFRRAEMTEEIFGKEVCQIFRNADYRICNLEGCFTEESAIPKLKDGPNIRAPKECIAAISELGVNCVSLANNHVTDYGVDGLEDTWSVLNSAGISYFGAGRNAFSITNHIYREIKGIRFIFYGVSERIENCPTEYEPGVNIYDEYLVCKELRHLKTKCDYLIVLYHGGIENYHYNTPSITRRFHRMADNGADIIISQHTHAIGEEEYYQKAYLLYGQGNFCFHFSKNVKEWNETALLLSIDFRQMGFNVEKHVVKREGDRIVFPEQQDLSEFYERSDRLKKRDSFEDEFKAFADEKVVIYLQAFRGKNLKDRILRKILTREKYIAYLRKQYTQKQILKILLALQSEEFREVSSRGIMNMLDETKT